MLWSIMVTFSLPKESLRSVDLRCLLSGRSGFQFAPVAIQAFTKLMLSFDVLKATNCTIQEVDNIDKVPRWDENFVIQQSV
jgi:hypothetical protein